VYQYINLKASNIVCCYVNIIYVETSSKKCIAPESAKGKGKGKGKANPLQAWTSPEDSRRLKLPDFKTIDA